MRLRYLLPVLLLIAGGGVAAWYLLRQEAPLLLPPWTASHKTAAEANNAFAFDLYAKLRTQPGNLFVSPLVIHANLAQLASGSSGNTRAELLKALHLPNDFAAHELTEYYIAPRKGCELKLAAALWGDKTTAWNADFVAKTPGFRTADFAGNADRERGTINKWILEQTEGRIRELLPAGSVDNSTQFVCANTIFFKGEWRWQFDPDLTDPQDFTKADGTKVQTPMMSFRRDANLKVTGYQQDPAVLELPYRDEEFSLWIVLPKQPDGLPKLESQLSAEMLAKWQQSTREQSIQAVLPKFRHEWRPQNGDLTPMLKLLGIQSAFDGEKADFRPMTAGKFWVDAVRTAAVVEIDEVGTTAAAAAASGMKSAPGRFTADRPFLYWIQDNKNGTILFIGRYESP